MANARFLLQNYRIDDLRAALARRGLSDAGTALEVAERVAANRIRLPVAGPRPRESKRRPAKPAAPASDLPAVRTGSTKPGAAGRCLSVRQPWAALIVLGIKKVENRSWATNYRGRLWIHAAASRPSGGWARVFNTDPPIAAGDAMELPSGVVLPPFRDLPLSAIIGSVELYDCLDQADLPPEWDADPFAGGPYCWLMRDPRPMATPFPCKGALRLWTPPAGLNASDSER